LNYGNGWSTKKKILENFGNIFSVDFTGLNFCDFLLKNFGVEIATNQKFVKGGQLRLT
jgi:hypothetical protein